MAIVKATLFAVLFGFAWINRYRLAPALLGEAPDIAKRVLVRSIALQTIFGLAIVVAAGILSSVPPGLHTQSTWRGSRGQPGTDTRSGLRGLDPALDVMCLRVSGKMARLLVTSSITTRWNTPDGEPASAICEATIVALQVVVIL
jgi:hypothetical protein